MANFITDLRSSSDEPEIKAWEPRLPKKSGGPRVLKILEGAKSEWPNGAVNRTWIPQPGIDHLNPFVHFMWLHMPAGAEGKGLHFNEGVEIVTFLAKGGYRHEDQHRGFKDLEAGSVEYQMAGNGIWHQEHALKDRSFEAFQLIMTLPARNKIADPRYMSFKPDQSPLESKGDFSLRFLAGGGSALKTVTPLSFVLAQVEPGARAALPGADGRQAFVCMVEGKCLAGGALLKAGELALLSGSETFEIEAGEEPVSMLLVSGRPVRE